MEAQHYVPIVLTRLAERAALRDAPAAVRDSLTPLFVVPPIEWDYEEEEPAKSLADHLSKLPAQLGQAWSASAFIDLLVLDDDGPLAGGVHPLVWLTAQCNHQDLRLIPTVSPNRSAAYRAATASVIARDHRGVCVRLQVDEWPSSLRGALDDLLLQLNVGPEEVDLLLDLADESGALALTALRQEIATLPTLPAWRSLMVAGAGMPKEMPSGAGVHVLPRHEWQRYQSLLGPTHSLPARTPTFADYAIAHPDPTLDIDPKLMSLSASFRYATSDNWLLVKGKKLFKGAGGTGIGAAAVPPVAKALLAHADYLGAGHCAAEDWLVSVAQSVGSGGNPTVWRRYGTLHHLTVATAGLATLHAALAAP
jgi:hypothetical protein